jgi:hypothetical protein
LISLFSIFFHEEKNSKIRKNVIKSNNNNKSLQSTSLHVRTNRDGGNEYREARLFSASPVDSDTSFCVKYLTEDKGYEVHSIIVNTGGFTEEELKMIEAHAYKLGVKTHSTVNAVKNYYDRIIKYLVFGNVLKNNTYPFERKCRTPGTGIAYC